MARRRFPTNDSDAIQQIYGRNPLLRCPVSYPTRAHRTSGKRTLPTTRSPRTNRLSANTPSIHLRQSAKNQARRRTAASQTLHAPPPNPSEVFARFAKARTLPPPSATRCRTSPNAQPRIAHAPPPNPNRPQTPETQPKNEILETDEKFSLTAAWFAAKIACAVRMCAVTSAG